MNNEQLEIHDSHQMELRMDYPMGDEEKTSYNTEMYFYFPKKLGINKQDYPKWLFYRDTDTFIQFKAPSFTLKELLTKIKSPLRALTKYDRNKQFELQIFGCVLKESLDDWIAKNSNPSVRAIKKHLEELIIVRDDFRRKAAKLRKKLILKRAVDFTDEYISILIENHCFMLIKRKKSLGKIKQVIRHEYEHRQRQGYKSTPSDDKKHNEYVIYRRSMLKRYHEQALLVHNNKSPEGRIGHQLISSLSAGIAMIIATVLAFYTQTVLETKAMPFFTAIIIIYVFKDRIKEGINSVLSTKYFSNVYDQRTRISSYPDKVIGDIKEKALFVDRAPQKIQDIRNKDHLTEIEDEWIKENILLYKKKVVINNNHMRKEYDNHDFRALSDITRFSIQHFLSHMNDPEKTLKVLKNNRVADVSGERVYHINVVVKMNHNNRTKYKRTRIVLNKKGILRVESLNDA